MSRRKPGARCAGPRAQGRRNVRIGTWELVPTSFWQIYYIVGDRSENLGACIRHIEIRKGKLGPSLRILPTKIFDIPAPLQVRIQPAKAEWREIHGKNTRSISSSSQKHSESRLSTAVEFMSRVRKITNTKLIFFLVSSSIFRLISMIICTYVCINLQSNLTLEIFSCFIAWLYQIHIINTQKYNKHSRAKRSVKLVCVLKFRLFKKTTQMWRNLPVCWVKFKATGRFHQLLVASLSLRKSELMSLATPARAAWLICYLSLALPRFQLKTMGPNRQAQAGLAIEPPGAPVAAAAGVSAAATDSNWLSFCSLSGRPFIVTKARLSHCINWIGLKGWRSLLHFAGHVRSLKLSRPRSHCVLKWGFTRTFLVKLYMQKQMRV